MARVIVMGSLAESLVVFRGSLIGEMVKRGHKVFACAPNASETIKHELSQIGAEYHNVTLERTGLNPYRDLIGLVSIIKLVRKLKPDVFLGYTPKPIIYGSIASRICKVPRIFSMIEGLGYTFFNDGFKVAVVGLIINKLFWLSLKFNQKIFFLNSDNLKMLVQKGVLGKSVPAVVLNGIGVDLTKFAQVELPTKISFLMIARLLRDKGVSEYIHAAQIIKNKHPETLFRFIGWHDENNPNAISEHDRNLLKSSHDIQYIDRLDDVRPVMAETSVYVLPSYHEGVPVTVMEAMAMGRPIITTDAPGCRETVVDGENGFLIPVRNVEALVAALEHFVRHSNDVQKMGESSRRIAERKFDTNKINAKLLLETGLN